MLVFVDSWGWLGLAGQVAMQAVEPGGATEHRHADMWTWTYSALREAGGGGGGEADDGGAGSANDALPSAAVDGDLLGQLLARGARAEALRAAVREEYERGAPEVGFEEALVCVREASRALV